jgi:hypothetical protein
MEVDASSAGKNAHSKPVFSRKATKYIAYALVQKL